MHFSIKTQDHRIIEWFGLEGAFKGHLVQPPCNKQGHLQLSQVAQSPIQPDLECFQGQCICSLFGQPVCVSPLIIKIFFLISKLNLPSFSLEPSPLVVPLQALLKTHEVHTAPLLLLVQVPLNGIPSLRHISHTTEHGVICKFAVLNHFVYVIDEDDKQYCF